VYNDVVSRTQVYLGEEELALLDRAAQATGASRSALIRRAVRESFGTTSKAERLRALRASAGSWQGRALTGAEYVDEVRGDLNDRLRRLGLR
jgi:Arc/MetJ-type ribon-helix-helix transcriptional regulator